MSTILSSAHQADAYASFATISALVFGFSISVVWTPDQGEHQGPRLIFQTLLICSTISFSSVSLVVHGIQYYVVKEHIAKGTDDELTEWMVATRGTRRWARYSLWLSLTCFMMSTLLLLVGNSVTSLAVIGSIILTAGMICAVYIILYMRPAALAGKKTPMHHEMPEPL